MKARLCNKDMCNLVDVLRELPETLEGIGVAGIATITVTDDGSISGVLAVSPDRRDYEERDSAQEAWLQRRPVCVCCGEHIQDESAHLIGGDYYCDRCLDDTTG